MNLKIGGIYFIRIKTNDKILFYEARILDVDDSFITFLDKFGSNISVRKELILTCEEITK